MPYECLNKFYKVYVAAMYLVSIISRHSLIIEVYHRNLTNKSKQSLYKSFLQLINSYLKQLYISNMMVHFSYKSRCGVMYIKAFKRRNGLSYGIDKQPWVISNLFFELYL